MEMNILTLKMLRIICLFCVENKYFPSMGGGGGGGGGGGSAKFSQNVRLASLATVQFSNNFSGSLRLQF